MAIWARPGWREYRETCSSDPQVLQHIQKGWPTCPFTNLRGALSVRVITTSALPRS